MSETIAIDQLPAALQEMLRQYQGANGTLAGRSPHRGVLHDLRIAPSATEPRPLFTSPTSGMKETHEPYRHQAYPKLKFRLEEGKLVEITVKNEAADAALGSGWADAPPIMQALTAADRARREFEMLSPDDQALVLEMQAEQRRSKVQAALSSLSQAEIDELRASLLGASSGDGASEVEPRKRGRPSKVTTSGDGA